MSTTIEDARRHLEQRRERKSGGWLGARNAELLMLVAASALSLLLLLSAFNAKQKTFASVQDAVNINMHPAPERVNVVLAPVTDAARKSAVAERIEQGGFTHVGDLARTGMLNRTELHDVKPFLVVRTPEEFKRTFWLYGCAFVCAFFLLHFYWRFRGFAGDQMMLPCIEVLCGIGITLMLSMGDPLRDSLQFASFAQGIFIGLAVMALASGIDYNRRFRRFSYVFIALAAVLGLLLLVFGKGPTGSDAKVTLFGFFEPVEVMRLLIVAFLAGYLGEHWDVIRDTRARQGIARQFRIPRMEYVTPIVIGIGIAVLLFYLVKDNGPALVVGVLFLAMYAAARKRAWAAIAGFGFIVFVFWFARIEHFQTVSQRIEMWSSPWRNTVYGGDQLAQSLWALSSGGTWGAGAGKGSVAEIPAGATDLILSSAGEELGFFGLAVIFGIYGLLTWRGLRVALRSSSPYLYFLGLGITLAITLQLLLIAGGILGLIPLSGVVSPFLCYGKTSMVANFAAFGILLAISARDSGREQKPFRVPAYAIAGLLACCWVVLIARCFQVQVAKADDILVRDAEVRYRTGTLGLEYNPRLNDVVREIARGDVTDRNGLPLATSHWDALEAHRGDYSKLGVNIDAAANHQESRHYPLGPEFFYLVGDIRSGLQSFIRTNAVERASRSRLLGFDEHMRNVRLVDPKTGDVYYRTAYDFRALIPLVRHGLDSKDAQVRSFLAQNRNVKMSIDANLQQQVANILARHLSEQGQRGAAVVMDPDSGDLLASVSYPWPSEEQFAMFRKNADKTMASEWQDRALFGLYPPGSSFKIVTAIAALRTNPDAGKEVFECKPLGDGRVGNYVGRSTRPVRDDVQDKIAHGRVDLHKGIVVSCNAFFAQLGYSIGAAPLLDAAKIFHIQASPGNSLELLKRKTPQAAYGQGDVVATPFQMARVAATIADDGAMPQGRWVIDESNPRTDAPSPVLNAEGTAQIAAAMREVVTSPAGTGKVLRTEQIPIAGKTGTAQLDKGMPHAWFIGYAPYGPGKGKRVAFAVLVEHGEYGGRTAAPIAGEIVEAAQKAGYVTDLKQ